MSKNNKQISKNIKYFGGDVFHDFLSGTFLKKKKL